MIVHPYIQPNQDVYVYDDPTLEYKAVFVNEAFYFGASRALGQPDCIYYNGNFYLSGYKLNTYDNQALIAKYNRANGITTAEVGSGTTPANEPDDHPVPAVYVSQSTGYVYMIQNKYHNSYFRVFKSTSAESITLTYSGEITDGGASYITIVEASGSDITFVTRGKTGGTNNLWYCFACCTVNLDTLVYTHTQITSIDFATNAVRHYPNATPIYVYGTPTVYFMGINHRWETNGYVYKISILATSDWSTFTNYANTFSKDVIGVSPITEAELESNCVFVGTDSTKTNNYTPIVSIQVDDNMFILYKKLTTTRFYISKIAYEGSITTFEITLDDAAFDQCYMYYNGTNIIMTFAVNDGSSNIDNAIFRVAGINTDLTGYTLFADLLETPRAANTNLVSNFDDMPSGTYYPIMGAQKLNQEGMITYYESNKSWSI